MLLKLIWLLLAGAAGTLARFGTVTLAQRFWPMQWPLGTAIANVCGCLIAGVVFGWLQKNDVAHEDIRLVLLVGFCGAFTTFSALILEAGQLQQEVGWASALGLIALHVVLGCAALAIGWAGAMQWV